MQKIILESEPYNYPPPVRPGFRRQIYKIYIHKYTSILLVLTILCNFILLALNQPGISKEFENNKFLATNALVGIYILEFLMKIISFGPRGYFSYTSNIFEMSIIIIYVLHAAAEKILIVYLQDESTSLFLGFRVLKMLRVLSILRIIEFMPGLQRLLKGMVFTLPFLLDLNK